MRRKSVLLLLSVLSITGLAVVTAAVADYVSLRKQQRALSSPDPKVRRRTLERIADRREQRLTEAVFQDFERESDPELIDASGYAILRMRDRRGVALLQKKADALPDSPTRAGLITYAVRLSDRDIRLAEWLQAGLERNEPWQRVGSALGLLELARPEGGQALLAMVPQFTPDMLKYALKEFRRIAEPMTQAVGQPLASWPDANAPTAQDSAWAELGQFWQRQATPTLLTAVLNRLERQDLKWHEVNRLLHARPRAERLLK